MKRAGVAGIVVGALLAVGGLGVVGALASQAAVAGSAAPASTPTATAAPPINEFAADGLQDPTAAEVADPAALGIPTRIQIPRIGVDSTLEHLALGAGGELNAPVDFDLAGWYAGGVAPGGIGPAIIAGHVDSAVGPAVFARIGELVPGDEILVTTSTGTALTFVVTGSAQSAKAAFPTDEVYSNVPRPELRLITCAGAFDRSVGHYTDNLIQFASLRG